MPSVSLIKCLMIMPTEATVSGKEKHSDNEVINLAIAR